MAKQKYIALDFEIDKLTNSIENKLTGESFPTEVSQLTFEELNKVTADKTWQFDWGKEHRTPTYKIYKLTTVAEPQTIQGLISIKIDRDHVFLSLVESAKHNFGKNKTYAGVPGNLVAFACKVSVENGFDGFVAFVPKTQLIEHYKQTLGAVQFRNRMFIMPPKAKQLIQQYFNT